MKSMVGLLTAFFAQATAPTYFHASDHRFEPGDVVRPGREVGKAGHSWGMPEHSDHVWMQDDVHELLEYGEHIYEVRPHGTPQDVGGHTHIAPAATVVRKVQPGEEYRGLAQRLRRQAAALPPPHPNPHDGGSHWYHGTGVDEASFDEDEDQDPEARMPGGKLRSPDTWEAEYGQNASKHWNTGMGVHFTSRHHVARGFATNDGGHETKAHPGARVAHAMLHMANPKHYDSEFDMAHDAVDWAHANGHHYLSEEARSDPETDDHILGGGSLHDIPGHEDEHEHLAYLDDHVSQEGMRSIHAIDTQRPFARKNGKFLDQYLSAHPARPEIIEGFKSHLKAQGHDGVTYGNEYEAPIGHRCAIPLDDNQIHIRHWQWLHPKEQHRNRSAEGEEPLTQPEHLVQRDYTPEDGHHWVGPDGKKLSVLASAPKKPDYVPVPEGASDDENMAHWDGQRKIKNDWQTGIRQGLSEGRHTNQEAREAGYSGVGHDQHENGYEPHYGLKWKPLPSTLYHVTTHRDAVLKDGLKSRDDLAQDKGLGLGGGESDTISFTEDPETAHHIHRALHEYHSLLNKPLAEATQQMMDEAEKGGYAHQVRSVEGDAVDRRLKGHVSVHDSEMNHIPMHQKFMTEAEAKERVHPGAELDPQRTVSLPGEEPRSMAITRPATEEEGREQISSHYKSHAWMRGSHGGPMDPLFSQNDVHGFAKMDPKQFAVIKAHPKPGAQGYLMGSLGEWRTASSKAVDIAGVDESLHHTGGLNGGLPEGFSIDEPRYNDMLKRHDDLVMARVNGQPVGMLQWHHHNGEITDIRVHPDYRRRGVADAMWNHVHSRDEYTVKPVHSGNRSDSGEAWAQTHGEPQPRTSGEGTDESYANHHWAGLNGDLPEGLEYSHSTYTKNRSKVHILEVKHPDYTDFPGRVGHLSWVASGGRIQQVQIHPDFRRKGLATELLRRAREIQPEVHHSDNLSDDGKSWSEKISALLPGYEHEHDWLPDHGIFSRTKAELDPVLFGRRGKMRKCVKKVVLARMDAAVREVYPDWRDWTRSYFAGGEASLWWGNHDLDVLVGIDYDKERKAHPEDADLSNEEISAKITRLWRLGYNSETWTAPWDGEEWHVTAFSNPESWDIRDIKPYAAYLMDTDAWVVKPPKVDATWGPGSFPESDWNMGEGYLKAIDAIDKITDAKQRAREGAALYEYLHGHRRDAFGAHGQGWMDPANVLWKFLEYHPSAPVEKLVSWAHQWNEAKAAAA